VSVIPVTDAYREGWERVFGKAHVPGVQGVTESSCSLVGDSSLPKEEYGRFPLGFVGPLAFDLTGCMVGYRGGC